ncbi:amidohydrolase family protein [Paeniglutamicibacter cryotolerans]|uniref:Amidohydrolase-related domain-containing protein n=1 Tax=Paeniglutamicibacter cryotolerans TaxID=670079 RepID=A0A839QMF6_9MICC|nr:amidohydrolase family protein [Paeniglutamicibacter cryotolerans]MBB2995186.1 hypothetical protein [Paeniglutamicibacter cryotolerans]
MPDIFFDPALDPLTAGPLVDHHCHGVISRQIDRVEFENLSTESNWAPPAGSTVFDTQLGFLIRSRCAPLLGLPAHAAPESYLARRAELGGAEVNRRLLSASGIGTYVIETGYRGDEITTPAETAALTAAGSAEVLRLERLAEQLLDEGVPADDFIRRYDDVLAEAAGHAAGFKSIAAYRIGLDFDPAAPEHEEVLAAVIRWRDATPQGESARLQDPVIIRHLLECATKLGRPLQFHIGYGDDDVNLDRCNPLLLTDWLRRIQDRGSAVMLLHCYPYHREAGYLAHVFPHVYADVGLSLNYTGSRATAVLAEFLELIPFHKALFSSDAFGLAELYHLGAALFRRAYGEVVRPWIASGDWSAEDARRVFEMIGWRNAERVYRLTRP